MIEAAQLTQIGRFGKPHGVRGEVSALVDTDIDALPCIFVEMDGLMVPFFVENVRTKGVESVLLTIEGIDTQEKAAAFTNRPLFARTADLPDDENDEEGFYLDDLVGWTIVDGETTIGTIEDFDDSTANYLFHVLAPDGSTIIVPASTDLIEGADADTKTLFMNLPEGLLELV